MRNFKTREWVFILCFGLGTFFFWGGCGLFQREDTERGQIYLKMGIDHFDRGNYPEALGAFLKAEEVSPEDPMIQNYLGLAYFVREKFKESEDHLRRALELRADYTDARNNLGRVLLESSQYKKALTELKVASEDLTYAFPEKPLTNLGIVLFKLEKYNQAKDVLFRALRLQKENCLAQNYLGRSFYEMKSYARAGEVLERAIKVCDASLVSQFDEPLYYSALSHFKTKNMKKAQSRLEEILKSYPDGNYRDQARKALATLQN